MQLYILWGAPILALFNCLTFLNLDIPSSWKAIWCGFTYIGCGMAYTAVNISTQCVANCMAALVFSVVCIPCFWVCFASTKEILGSTGKKESVGDTMKNLINSFKFTFKDRNAVFLMLAMLTFLTGLFGRIGIMAYYFIYVMGNPVLIAGFATAMSAGMLVVNFYALSAVGYVANAQNLPAEVLTRMDMVINFAPAAFFVIAAVFFLSVGMTREKAKANEAQIAKKVAAGELK